MTSCPEGSIPRIPDVPPGGVALQSPAEQFRPVLRSGPVVEADTDSCAVERGRGVVLFPEGPVLCHDDGRATRCRHLGDHVVAAMTDDNVCVEEFGPQVG